MKLTDILTEVDQRTKAKLYDDMIKQQEEEAKKQSDYYTHYGKYAEKKDKRNREGKTSVGKAALGGIVGTGAVGGAVFGASKLVNAMPKGDAYKAGRIGAGIGTIGSGIAAGATAAHFIRKGLDAGKRKKEQKIKEKINNYTESLQLSISNIPLTEGMSDIYFLMRVLDENGFAVTDNNIAVLAEAINCGHIEFI